MKRATILLATVAVLLLLSGCIVIPIGDLLKRQPLNEEILVDGEGLFEKQKIAIVEVNGVIRGESDFGLLSSQDNSVTEFRARLKKVQDDADVKAVVVRIASPGGEVTACDIMYNDLVRFKQDVKIPVVSCIVEQGASGGYYIAMGTDHVIAHPTAIVGSVGVILQSFDLSGLMEIVGVKSEPVKSSDQKDLNSPFRPMASDERVVLQKLVDDLYARFVDVVDRGRPELDNEKVKSFSDGRVVSGESALELGMVDQTGYLADAIEVARVRGNITSPTIVHYTRPGGSPTRLTAALDDTAPSGQGLEMNLRVPQFNTPKFYYLWRPGF